MSHNTTETSNLDTVRTALAAAEDDFTIFFERTFTEDTDWTIAGHGPVARRYSGMKDLAENAENALFARLAGPLAIRTIGLWADGDDVIARIDSTGTAIDGLPYRNGYLYILTMKEGKVVSGIEWLDLHAYYEIVERVAV